LKMLNISDIEHCRGFKPGLTGDMLKD